MRISVHDQIGPYAITIEDGELIYAQAYAQLSCGLPIQLDFAQVEIVAAPFLSAAVGALVGDFGLPHVRRLLTAKNLPKHAEGAWELVLLDSEEYYALDQDARDEIDEIVARAAQAI